MCTARGLALFAAYFQTFWSVCSSCFLIALLISDELAYYGGDKLLKSYHLEWNRERSLYLLGESDEISNVIIFSCGGAAYWPAQICLYLKDSMLMFLVAVGASLLLNIVHTACIHWNWQENRITFSTVCAVLYGWVATGLWCWPIVRLILYANDVGLEESMKRTSFAAFALANFAGAALSALLTLNITITMLCCRKKEEEIEDEEEGYYDSPQYDRVRQRQAPTAPYEMMQWPTGNPPQYNTLFADRNIYMYDNKRYDATM